MVTEAFTEGLGESEIPCVCVCVCVFVQPCADIHIVVPWSTLIMVHRSEFSIWELLGTWVSSAKLSKEFSAALSCSNYADSEYGPMFPTRTFFL